MNNIILMIVARFIMATIFACGGIYALRKGFQLIYDRKGLKAEGSIIKLGKFSANLKTVGSLVMLTSVVWAYLGYLTAPKQLNINPDKGLIEFSRLDISSKDKIRAVSLKILQKNFKTIKNRKYWPKKYFKLHYLKIVHGFLIDEKNNDIIIFGKLAPERPELYIDDFVVALRNAWAKYYQKEGQFYPSVSIDPDPIAFEKLQKIAKNIYTGQFQKEWEKVCKIPYKVSIKGIPFYTRFSKIMVEADYKMKKIVAGSDSIDIAGFVNIDNMLTNMIRKKIKENKLSEIRDHNPNRFWFYPGENEYEEWDGIVIIKQYSIKLLTEQQFLNFWLFRNNEAHNETLFEEYSKQFSAYFPKIAKRYPIFQELENLFRFVTLANILHFKFRTHSSLIDEVLSYFIKEFPLEKVNVPTSLYGISSIKKIEYNQKLEKSRIQVIFPVCGGVIVKLDLSSKDIKRDNSGYLSKLKELILDSRPSRNSLYWDVTNPKD